jgi:hypothetical protein
MPDPWITPDDVAEYLGTVAADDPRVVRSTAAVKAAVERRRSDLTFTDATTAPEDVRLGATMWASVMVQQRSAPGGYDGYDAETALADAGAKRAEIYRLLGFRRPVVA